MTNYFIKWCTVDIQTSYIKSFGFNITNDQAFKNILLKDL